MPNVKAELIEIGFLPEKIPKFSAYKRFTPATYEKTVRLSRRLSGKTIFHINSTASGGGVAELLKSQVPLERSLGLDSRWFVIRAHPRFFEVTKKIHNLLQGKADGILNVLEKEIYLETNRKIAESLAKILAVSRPSVVVTHDPQPLPLVEAIPAGIEKILRMHIDSSTPDAATFEFLREYMLAYDRVIFTHPLYRPQWLPKSKMRLISPAINPFTAKNQETKNAKEVLILRLGINATEPLVSQISRFDPWKDPMGAIESYYLAKNEIPNLQLILAGAKADDDPEAVELLERVRKHAKGDPDIFFFTQTDDATINAIQSASDVIMQKSIREGFGLTVTEAMWKRKPVVGGRTAGIAMQIQNGKNGFLVSSPQEAADALVRLMKSGTLRKKIGAEARKTVKEKFLMSRLVLDHLRLYAEKIRR